MSVAELRAALSALGWELEHADPEGSTQAYRASRRFAGAAQLVERGADSAEELVSRCSAENERRGV